MRAVTFCERQNIALQGHRDRLFVFENCGNFLALLHLLAEYDDDLRSHLEHGKKNALYISKTIQNQIIAVIGDIIREKVSSAIREDGAIFSIIADEVTESHSNKEILSLCLRFVSWDDQIPYNLLSRKYFFILLFLQEQLGLLFQMQSRTVYVLIILTYQKPEVRHMMALLPCLQTFQVFKLAFGKLHHLPFTPIAEAMFLI